MSPKSKCGALMFSGLLCVLILLPIKEQFKEVYTDSFPFSNYPMFTTVRGHEYKVRHPIFTDAEGNQYHVPYYYAGNGGFNQTRRQIARAVREGKTIAICEMVYAHLQAKGFETTTPIEYISVVTSTYDLEAYYEGELKLLRRRTHMNARIPSESE